MRTAEITRKTSETSITAAVNLDGTGKADIKSGVGFFDHCLTSLSKHSGIDITVCAEGDLFIDSHHTVEDIGIVLGAAFAKALGDCAGIERFASAFLPMDEALAFAAIDISKRPYLVFEADFTNDKTGEFDNCLTEEFFRAFAINAGVTLHIKKMYGKNDHHAIEAIFKAAARAIKTAVKITGSGVPSTKGSL
ncbi:MAG: imidazoleglycerol-phosphate dehydratase HisB [Ruminococcus sp.]|jgi:imidazoleglycerol-phosphate dehydratase|nr:imidazoleglycerol-phosphate dehydratase HisB [Ruminococcus sp.]